MLDLLSTYLNRVASPEQKLLIENATKVLDDLDPEDYEYVIEEILFTEEEMDAGAPLQSILNLIYDHLCLILKLHGIIVSNTMPLGLLTDLVRGIHDLDNHENCKQLIDQTEDESPPIEILCELMSMVTQHMAEEFMPYIEDVSEGLFARLKDNEDASTMDDPNELNHRRESIHAYRKYEIFLTPLGGQPIYLEQMLHSGMDVSLPFLLYAKSMPVPFEQLNAKAIAKEMFGMALISSDGYNRPIDMVKQHIEEFISSPELMMQVVMELNQLQAGYAP